MKENIIGREQEISKLENYISSRKIGVYCHIPADDV